MHVPPKKQVSKLPLALQAYETLALIAAVLSGNHNAFRRAGFCWLSNKRRGPKRNYRRTGELVRQVIRHRFLDPDATPEVIAQKLRQTGFVISTRSVERVIAEYGLQKKTLRLPPSK